MTIDTAAAQISSGPRRLKVRDPARGDLIAELPIDDPVAVSSAGVHLEHWAREGSAPMYDRFRPPREGNLGRLLASSRWRVGR